MHIYCEEYINEKNIWASVHHPQTMGNLSANQKHLERNRRKRLGRYRDIRKKIIVSNHSICGLTMEESINQSISMQKRNILEREINVDK